MVRTSASPRPGCGLVRSARANLRGAIRTAARIRFSCARALAARERRIARHRVDHGNLLYGEAGDDLDTVAVHDQHFLDAHAPLELLAVLGFQGEHHALADLDWMVERPDA